jgi:RNA polymerase sigma factor (sigma-70 family)
MKINITRECLDQSVFDLGFEGACIFYGLTETQGNKILFDKVTSKMPERYRWVEPEIEEGDVATQSKDYNKLKNWIAKNFTYILSKHKATSSKNIDARAYSPYDRCLEVLTTLLWHNEDYIYVNDAETEAYVSAKLSRGTADLRKENSREKAKAVLIPLDEELDIDEYIDRSTEDAENVMGRFSKKQQEVVDYVVGGYSQVEIAEKMGVKQSAISQQLKTIRKKLLVPAL